MSITADSELPAPKLLPPKIQLGTNAFFILSGVILIVLGLLGWLSLSQVTKRANHISKNSLPLLASVKESHLALGKASLALEHALGTQNGLSDIGEFTENEALFRSSLIKFEAFTAAMTWGTESKAFAESGGGIDRYEWQKLNYQQALKMEPPSGAQSQLAGQASIYFAGFAKNGSKAIAAHRRFLHLSETGRLGEAASAERESKESFVRAEGFAEHARTKLLEIEKESSTEVAANSRYIDAFSGFSKWGLLLLPLFVALALIALGLTFSRIFIVQPMTALLRAVNQLAEGDLSKRVESKTAGIMSVVIQAFNALAEKLQKRQEGLEHQVASATAEFEKNRQSANTTQQAMMNLLSDAKDLEEQLKQEKAGVEKKVVDRTKELMEEHARLEASVNSLTIGFIMTDGQHTIITINPRAQEILFSGDDENKDKQAPKMGFTEVEERLSDADIRKQIDTCLKTGKSSEVKELLYGSHFLHIYFAPIIEPGTSRAIGTVMLLEDITQEKVLQRSRDEFFSIASHELRTPLTAIKGNTSMIQQYYSDQLKDDSLREMVSDIHDSSNRLIDIVNDFLDASKLEQGKFTFKNGVFNIAKIIESVVYEIGQVSKDKGIYIKMDGNLDSYPLIYADKDRAKQIIYNLVGNAMKFTEKGGVTLSPVPENGLLKILVKDTGRGIPKDKLSLLFHKFQQAGSSILTRDSTRGTGLGLYISKLLAENMGGEVKIEGSEPGKGTTFSFTLPMATPEQIKAQPAKIASV